MNVSEIMDAELRYLAIQGATLAIRSLAQAELDRRNHAVKPVEKAEVAKSCDNCGDAVCFAYRTGQRLEMRLCASWYRNPTERAEIEPLDLIDAPYGEYNMSDAFTAINHLIAKQREIIKAVNAVERRGK